jgi:thiamine biosynthesis lipoprotein
MKSLVLLVALLLLSVPAQAESKRAERYIPDIMDTTASITIYESSAGGFFDRIRGLFVDSDSDEVLDEIEQRWREIESILSVYNESAEAYRLNKYGYIENASDELLYMLEQSLYYYNITGGVFDITVQPLLDLWSSGLWQKSAEEQKSVIEETKKIIGSDKIVIDGRRVYFKEKGMKITLGGIGKGYALDEAVKILKRHGITNALIRLGGQEYCLGINPERNSPWTIGLTNPDDTSQAITAFAVTNASVSTSGNYERYFSPDKSVNHIMDPRTGFSASPCISATIIAENATAADALSTSVFVLGPEDGLKLVESIGGVEAMIIDNSRNIYRSSGMSRYEIP